MAGIREINPSDKLEMFGGGVGISARRNLKMNIIVGSHISVCESINVCLRLM